MDILRQYQSIIQKHSIENRLQRLLHIVVISASKHQTLTVGISCECLVSRLNDIIRLRGSFTLLARSLTLFTNFRLHHYSVLND